MSAETSENKAGVIFMCGKCRGPMRLLPGKYSYYYRCAGKCGTRFTLSMAKMIESAVIDSPGRDVYLDNCMIKSEYQDQDGKIFAYIRRTK